MKLSITLAAIAVFSALAATPSHAQAPAPGSVPARANFPPGVDSVYALESDNTLLLYATPEGYAQVRGFVRDIIGAVDIVRTEAALVPITPEAAKGMGVTVNSGAFAPGDAATLLAAYKSGKLKATRTVRITARENTVVDTLMGGTPLSVVTRVGRDGSVTVEVAQPQTAFCTAQSGETTALLLTPAALGETPMVLFLTPTILPSDVRAAR